MSTPSGCSSVEQSRPLKPLAYNKLSTNETAREPEKKKKKQRYHKEERTAIIKLAGGR